jgi:hypothetical protein
MARHLASRADAGPNRRSRRAVDARLAGFTAAAVLGLSLSGVLVLKGTEAAFTASTQNGANSWSSGSVAISDNDSGTALFSATNLAPGATATRCITLSYTGTVASLVRMYATSPTGGALAGDLDLVISTALPSNGNADPTCAGSYGAWTQVWSGTLATFNGFTSYAAPVPLAPAWTPASAGLRSYKIQYTLNSGSTQQSANTQTTFTWEARNT